MAAQLTLFGTAPPVVSEPVVIEPEPVPPQPAPVDPRQVWLLDGPHSVRLEAELLCEKLDAAALLQVWRKARQSYPTWPGSLQWPAWAEGISYLIGINTPISSQEQVTRALSFDGEAAMRRFPEMSAAQLSRVRSAALCRAAERLFEEEGLSARLPDGRPVGYLQLLAGVPDEAVATLEKHAPAFSGKPGHGLLLGYLGEALWRSGREREALCAYRDAYLKEPAAVDETELTCTPVLDLLDACAELELPADERAWLPVMADLLGIVALQADGAPLPPAATAAQVTAAQLASYRQRQAERMEEAERMSRKRELLKLAPFLKEQLRRL